MSMTETVRDHLQNCDLRRGKLYHTADVFGMSASVINVRLRNEGSRYSDLLDAERKRRCEILLTKMPDATLETIAKHTGYGAETVRRAIKRWFGVPISGYRSGTL